jgi:transglutaminase-like putative cysteine protease
MDFHAVAEAYLDGAWYVIDGTRLANRRSLVRIATGRDAADCAFLSYHGGYVGLQRMRVDAWVMPEAATLEGLETLPTAADPAHDDFMELVQLA